MNIRSFSLGLLSFIAVSCSYDDSFVQEDKNNSAEFYAIIDEQPVADTKVYADEDMKVLWNEDDRMSIFNKNTFNQEYKFLGDDGDNAGAIARVGDAGSGAPLEHIYAVYPYVESTSIDASGTLSFTLPGEQSYHKKSFGIGANTMVSVTDDIRLRFKNVGGYLSLKFYGEGVSVSSIVLKGNNGELLSGPCSIVTSGGIPAVTMSSGASDQVTLVCDPPVELGATSSEAVQFIFVLPPVTLAEGFTVTVTTPEGAVFEKSSSNKFEIGRSAITKLGAMEVVPEFSSNIVFIDSEVKRICVENWDTNGDGELDMDEAAAVKNLGNVFNSQKNITSFNEFQYFTGVTRLQETFWGCNNLISISLPEGLAEISYYAFSGCSSLVSLYIPASVIGILDQPYMSLYGAFYRCDSLESIVVSPDNPIYDSRDDCNAIIETASNKLIIGCKNSIIPETVEIIDANSLGGDYQMKVFPSTVTIPNSVKQIWFQAFQNRTNLLSVTIGDSVTLIGRDAFDGCSSLTSIVINATVPPTAEGPMFDNTNDCPIYVPAESVEAYKTAYYWSNYSSRIRGINTPVTGVSLNASAFSVSVGETMYLVATVLPDYASDQNVTWSSSNPSVATVDPDGKVTAVNGGSTTITARTVDGGFTAECLISVVKPVERIEIYSKNLGREVTDETITLMPFEQDLLSIVCYPTDATNIEEYQQSYNQYWQSSHKNVICTSGLINADPDLNNGVATITVGAGPGGSANLSAKCYVKLMQEDEVFEDLGLSVKWMKMNVYATTVSGLGKYYNWSDAVGAFYTNNSVSGTWRLPTRAQWQELIDGCDWVVTTVDGVVCYKITSKVNSKFIYLPLAGYYDPYNGYSSPYEFGERAWYWTPDSGGDYSGSTACAFSGEGMERISFVPQADNRERGSIRLVADK
ncbi:MAG: leucine-rich repeat protein [Bacteroidales bacterium]|nr:leucine-rich repeat protein [Bacteroidales bacterium]